MPLARASTNSGRLSSIVNIGQSTILSVFRRCAPASHMCFSARKSASKLEGMPDAQASSRIFCRTAANLRQRRALVLPKRRPRSPGPPPCRHQMRPTPCRHRILHGCNAALLAPRRLFPASLLDIGPFIVVVPCRVSALWHDPACLGLVTHIWDEACGQSDCLTTPRHYSQTREAWRLPLASSIASLHCTAPEGKPGDCRRHVVWGRRGIRVWASHAHRGDLRTHKGARQPPRAGPDDG